MDCPACKKPLVVVEHEGIEVDWCVACQGIWFDAGEVELLAEKAGREFVMPAPDPARAGGALGGSPRRCPRCPAKMSPQSVPCDPPIQVELCPRGHGIWLDRGELGALISAMPMKTGAQLARPVVSFLGEVFEASLGRRPAAGGEDADARRATPPAEGT